MKMPVQAVLKLSSMSATEKTTKGDYIAQQWELYGKEFPATCPNSPEDRAKATLRLSQAHAAALDGGRQAYLEEKAAMASFDALFGAYRDWANQPDVAYGDELLIGKLGLEPSRQEARRAAALPTPELLPLTGTNEGELTVDCPTVEDAKAYVCFVAYGEELPAEDAYRYCTCSTRHRFPITVDSGKRAWVRLLAVGVKGPSPLSAPVSRRVL